MAWGSSEPERISALVPEAPNVIVAALPSFLSEDIEWLFSAGSKITVKKDETLIKQGDLLDHVYLIIDGVMTPIIDGVMEDRTSVTGQILGELSFASGQGAIATVRAATETSLIKLSRKSLASKMSADAGFAARWYRTCSLITACCLRRRFGGEDDFPHQTAEFIEKFEALVKQLRQIDS